MVAASFADAGFSVVMDEVLATSRQVETLATQLSDKAVVIVGLAADTDTIPWRCWLRYYFVGGRVDVDGGPEYGGAARVQFGEGFSPGGER